jgi:hypothetical protein
MSFLLHLSRSELVLDQYPLLNCGYKRLQIWLVFWMRSQKQRSCVTVDYYTFAVQERSLPRFLLRVKGQDPNLLSWYELKICIKSKTVNNHLRNYRVCWMIIYIELLKPRFFYALLSLNFELTIIVLINWKVSLHKKNPTSPIGQVLSNINSLVWFFFLLLQDKRTSVNVESCNFVNFEWIKNQT